MSGGAFCEPTNALSSLQKRGTADRTLQQDRIRAQAGPSVPQGFRGPHTVSNNINHEFQQFSAATTDLLHGHSASGLPNWAAEFQQLPLSNPPPPLSGFQHTIPQATQAPPVSIPVSTTASSSWHTEFLSQPSQPATVYSPLPQQLLLHQQPIEHQFFQQQQPALSSLPDFRIHSQSDGVTNFHGSDTLYPHHVFDPETGILYPTYHSTSTTAEKTALDIAFDNAFANVQSLRPESSQHDLLNDSFDEQSTEDSDKGSIVEEGDELSRTAGHLLETLATEQSQKFRESNFMALMKKLRDKEVRVEGGEMVEVRGSSGKG